MEEFLFGKDIISSVKGTDIGSDHDSEAEEDEEDDVSVDIMIDTNPDREGDKDNTASGSVWHDEDDEKLQVDLTQTNRLKKLQSDDPTASSTVDGATLSSLLKNRFRLFASSE